MACVNAIVEDVGMAKIWKFKAHQVVAGAALLFGAAVSLFGQSAATLQGRAIDATGHPLRNAVVRLITDKATSATSRTWRYKFVVDEFGNYSQSGIAPGKYVALLFADGKGLDIVENVVLNAGDAKLVNFDLTRKDHGRTERGTQTAMLVDRRKSVVQVR